jgi:hypothetical protein
MGGRYCCGLGECSGSGSNEADTTNIRARIKLRNGATEGFPAFATVVEFSILAPYEAFPAISKLF